MRFLAFLFFGSILVGCVTISSVGGRSSTGEEASESAATHRASATASASEDDLTEVPQFTTLESEAVPGAVPEALGELSNEAISARDTNLEPGPTSEPQETTLEVANEPELSSANEPSGPRSEPPIASETQYIALPETANEQAGEEPPPIDSDVLQSRTGGPSEEHSNGVLATDQHRETDSAEVRSQNIATQTDDLALASWPPATIGEWITFLEDDRVKRIAAFIFLILIVLEVSERLRKRIGKLSKKLKLDKAYSRLKKWLGIKERKRGRVTIAITQLFRGFVQILPGSSLMNAGQNAVDVGPPKLDRRGGVTTGLFCSLNAIYYLFILFLGLQLFIQFGPPVLGNQIAPYAEAYIPLNSVLAIILLGLMIQMYFTAIFLLSNNDYNGMKDPTEDKSETDEDVEAQRKKAKTAKSPLWRANNLRRQLNQRGVSTFLVLAGAAAGFSINALPFGLRLFERLS